MNGTVGFIGIFSHRKFSAIYICFSEQIFYTKQSMGSLALFIGFVCSGVVVCLFVCLFFVAASPLCPVDGIAFALLSDVLSAPRLLLSSSPLLENVLRRGFAASW